MKEPEKITPDEFTAAMAWAQVEMEKESEAGNHLAVILASISAAMERKSQIQPLQSMKAKRKPKTKPKQAPAKLNLQELKKKVPEGAKTIAEIAAEIDGISTSGITKRLYQIKAKPCATVAYLSYYSKEDVEKVKYPLLRKREKNKCLT